MTLSTAAQATLLLTSYFSKPTKGAAKPLTPTEWGRFAQWLYEENHNPGDLLGHITPWVLGKWRDEKIPRERLEALLQRGSSMALAMEKWQRSGLWVITRSDSEYPRRLKKRLKHAAPPVLYGCGNAELLNAGGLAVVGSRKAGDLDLTYACKLGAKATQAAIGIVSGGAKGIDEAAMKGAIQEGGSVIGVLSEGLLKAATSSQWRQGLMSGGLVLVSPYYPEASFNTGNAMGRNKYIYCLADAAVVVHSGMKGGTKEGAEENLKKGWVPLWVKPTQDPEAGNQALVDAGGTWCEENIDQLDIASLSAPSETLPIGKAADQTATLPIQDGPTELEEGEAEKPQEAADQPVIADEETAKSQPEMAAEEAEPLLSSEEADAGGYRGGTLKRDGIPQADLFGDDTASTNGDKTTEADDAATVKSEPCTAKPDAPSKPESSQSDSAELGSEVTRQPEGFDFYRLFLAELQHVAQNPITSDDITSATGLHKTQVNAWLKQAVEEGRLKKLNRPVRYQAISADSEESSVVDDDVERLVRSLRSPRAFETS
ncbi:MAG: DNA-processing protein DprA [Pseudomonadota bacterium]